MTNQTTPTVQSLPALQKRLQHLNTIDNLSFRKIARLSEFLGVPYGTLAHVAKGREPKDPHTRVLLHLPVLAPAPVCLKCGEVHVSKRCTANKEPVKTRVKHICENCKWWEKNIPDEYTEGVSYGGCSSDLSNELIVSFHVLSTRPTFGCIFWKRKP